MEHEMTEWRDKGPAEVYEKPDASVRSENQRWANSDPHAVMIVAGTYRNHVCLGHVKKGLGFRILWHHETADKNKTPY